jgi:hypothetical protein
MLILVQNDMVCVLQSDFQDKYFGRMVHMMPKGRVCYRILDVWDICRPALLTLGFDVKIGDVQPSCGKWTESQVECFVNEDLFPSKDSYQIHINSDRVWNGFYLYYSFN